VSGANCSALMFRSCSGLFVLDLIHNVLVMTLLRTPAVMIWVTARSSCNERDPRTYRSGDYEGAN